MNLFSNVTKYSLNVTFSFLAVILAGSLLFSGCNGGSTTTTTTTNLTTSPVPTGGIMDFPAGKYTNTLNLISGNFVVSWSNTEDTVSIGIKAKSTGWLAIAFSPTLTKGRADLIIGSVVSGVVTLIDSYDPGFSGGHPQDDSVGGKNDLFDINGSESGGVTTIEFKRRLVTGDQFDIPLVNGSNPFLFAVGPDDTMASEHNLLGSGDMVITLTQQH